MKDPPGFSLLEVMMASALFLTSLSGLLAGLQTLQNVETHQRLLALAVRIGQGEMERALLLRPCGSVVPSSPDDPCLRTVTKFYSTEGVLRAGVTSAQAASDFTVTRSLVADAGLPSGLQRVDLVVRWSERQRVHDVEFSTYRP
jgi:prepilin-type N-terminal cleavage/methylation domain-containing protein